MKPSRPSWGLVSSSARGPAQRGHSGACAPSRGPAPPGLGRGSAIDEAGERSRFPERFVARWAGSAAGSCGRAGAGRRCAPHCVALLGAGLPCVPYGRAAGCRCGSGSGLACAGQPHRRLPRGGVHPAALAPGNGAARSGQRPKATPVGEAFGEADGPAKVRERARVSAPQTRGAGGCVSAGLDPGGQPCIRRGRWTALAMGPGGGTPMPAPGAGYAGQPGRVLPGRQGGTADGRDRGRPD